MYKGVLIPIITPFLEDGSIDEVLLGELVDFYLSARVQGLFALGSSGQGPALSTSERKQVAEVVIKRSSGVIPVIIHVGTADTPTTIELAQHAEECGASAIGIIPPYYYCDVPNTAILEHYRKVSEGCSLPIYIYENPKYCGLTISPQFALELKREVPTIRGIKVAYGAGAMADYVKLLPKDVSVFTGNADIFGLVPFGVSGIINPPTSSVPELCVALYQAIFSKEYAAAAELQAKVNKITQVFISTQKRYGRGTIAETFRIRGLSVKRFPRWKTEPIPDTAISEMRSVYRDVGVLA